MKIVNAYTVLPKEIEPGDVMLFIVKALVVRPGVYRLYRCVCKISREEDIPQGARMLDEEAVCKELFPSLSLVAKPDPYWKGEP